MADTNWLEVSYPATDFDALLAKFRTAESLPDLPASALHLCDAIDQEAETSELERIILSDPAITAGVLRAANSALFGGKTNQASTVKGSLLLLGQKAVRSISVSVWVQSLVHQAKSSPKFNPAKFAEHSMFVGFLSKYLLSTQQKARGFRSEWSPDELFAAGVLHDLGLGLLASVEPRLFERVLASASSRGLTFNEAFSRVTGREIGLLGVAAAQAWKLPDLFIDVLMGFGEPLLAEKEIDALCCVHYADYLANKTGYALQDWRVEVEIDPDIIARVGLDEGDIPDVLELVSNHTREFVKAA